MNVRRVLFGWIGVVTLVALPAAGQGAPGGQPPKSTLTKDQVELAKKVAAMVPERVAKKDFTAGQAAFTKAQCAACHTIDGGDKVGPTLQGVGRRGDVAYVIESIMEPTRMMVPGYDAELVETEEDSYIGFVKEEGDTLKITAQNVVSDVPKKDVTGRRKLTTSLMPPGLEKTLTTAEFADLVAYLMSLDKGGPDYKPVPGPEAAPAKK
jgi:putative heme-binding domain-containing protein